MSLGSNVRFTLKAWPVIFVITIALSYLTQGVAKWIFGVELPEQNQVEIVRKMFALAPLWMIILNFALILVISPVFEEAIFRWVTRLGWRTGGAKATAPSGEKGAAPSGPPVFWIVLIILTSALFSAAHYAQMYASSGKVVMDNAFLALFAFGVMQSLLYRKTRHLWCCMLNHALFNTTNLILLFVLPQ